MDVAGGRLCWICEELAMKERSDGEQQVKS